MLDEPARMQGFGTFAVTGLAREEIERPGGDRGALLESPEFGGEPILLALPGVLLQVLLLERRRTEDPHLHTGQ